MTHATRCATYAQLLETLKAYAEEGWLPLKERSERDGVPVHEIACSGRSEEPESEYVQLLGAWDARGKCVFLYKRREDLAR